MRPAGGGADGKSRAACPGWAFRSRIQREPWLVRPVGGKAGCAPASWLLLEAEQALVEEALAPLTDDLARGIQASRNDIVGQPLGGEQDQLGADDITIR